MKDIKTKESDLLKKISTKRPRSAKDIITLPRVRILGSKNIKILLLITVISLPFWFGVNVFEGTLEDFFFSQFQNNHNLIAYASRPVIDPSLKPLRNWNEPALVLKAKSAISIEYGYDGSQKVLFQKNIRNKLPMASLTKLMTGLLVSEHYQHSRFTVKISEEAANQTAESSYLKTGEEFYVEDLLHLLLMESSNGAAYSLSEVIGEKSFIELMNLNAETLGMNNTYFINPSGLDDELIAPDAFNNSSTNYSTVEDLGILAKELLQNPQLLNIISTTDADLYSSDGMFHHKLINTNKLLGEFPNIVGGKTGYTAKAGGCLLLILESPKNNNYLVNIILGSSNRFEEMRKLIEWMDKAYKW